MLVIADHGAVDVAEAVDLGGAEEPDVDQAALQVEAEQLEHRDGRGGAGDDGGVADRERQSRRLRPEGARFVDELQRGGNGQAGQVDGNVRQSDPTKQTRWPASSRAAATIIISDLLKAAVAGPGRRWRRRWSSLSRAARSSVDP